MKFYFYGKISAKSVSNWLNLFFFWLLHFGSTNHLIFITSKRRLCIFVFRFHLSRFYYILTIKYLNTWVHKVILIRFMYYPSVMMHNTFNVHYTFNVMFKSTESESFNFCKNSMCYICSSLCFLNFNWHFSSNPICIKYFGTQSVILRNSLG